MVERPRDVPDAPGVYLWRDAHGQVMYVGKAKSVRARLANYFARDLPARTARMVQSSEAVEWILTDSDVQALHLEFNLIKQHRPRFNIRLRDDKSFPYLAITMDDEWPRARVLRGRKRKGVRYFGPYAHAYAIRETLDSLLRTFPVRTCSDGFFRRQERLGRPCLLYHIERCSGPCIKAVAKDTYFEIVEDLSRFLEGETAPVLRRLQAEMHTAAEALEFEQAARFRDQLAAVRKAIERQEMVLAPSENLDVVGVVDDELEASVQIFHVRRGRLVGRRAFVLDKVEDVTFAGLVGRILELVYGDSDDIPREILVPVEPEEADLYTAWLALLRNGPVAIRIAQRGAKRRLAETATQNAKEAFVRHRLRRQQDHNARARALQALQDALDLPQAPLRIECFDISTTQGVEKVASMVVFEDGLPRRNAYRRFVVRDVAGQDDFASMEEAIRRRLRAYLRERRLPVAERGRFSYPPQLLLVDGGRGQLSKAVAVLDELGLTEEIPVAGLAKRLEEVYLPGQPEPLLLPRGSEALYILQAVRDEAHRFAITHHRERRGKRMMQSQLDTVPGLGPARREALVRRFGSVRKIAQASVDEIAAVPGLPRRVAEAVFEQLHGTRAAS